MKNNNLSAVHALIVVSVQKVLPQFAGEHDFWTKSQPAFRPKKTGEAAE